MSLEKYIRIYPAIPDAKTITKFLKYLNKTFKEKKFVTGSVAGEKEDIVNKEIRNVEILGLGPLHDSLSNVHWYNYLSYLIIQQMNKYIADFPDIHRAAIFDMQALRYGIGGHYKFHVDDGPTFNRKYSSILMLNNDFKGGSLCFKLADSDKIIKMPTKPGHVVIWPSNFMFPHAVEPLTEGVRYSVVSWMR